MIAASMSASISARMILGSVVGVGISANLGRQNVIAGAGWGRARRASKSRASEAKSEQMFSTRFAGRPSVLHR